MVVNTVGMVSKATPGDVPYRQVAGSLVATPSVACVVPTGNVP